MTLKMTCQLSAHSLIFIFTFFCIQNQIPTQERRSHGGLGGVPGGRVLQGQDRLHHRRHRVHGQGGKYILISYIMGEGVAVIADVVVIDVVVL